MYLKVIYVYIIIYLKFDYHRTLEAHQSSENFHCLLSCFVCACVCVISSCVFSMGHEWVGGWSAVDCMCVRCVLCGLYILFCGCCCWCRRSSIPHNNSIPTTPTLIQQTSVRTPIHNDCARECVLRKTFWFRVFFFCYLHSHTASYSNSNNNKKK